MPPLLAERLLHLDDAYPEWELPAGRYGMVWQGGYCFWSWTEGTDTLYAPPVAWKGELSPGLAHALRELARQIRVHKARRARPLLWSLTALGGLGLAYLLILHGPEHYTVHQEIRP